MSFISQETSGTVSLNLLLLFCVVLEPYLFFVLQNPSPQDPTFPNWASFAYALDVGGNFLILGSLVRVAVRSKMSSKEVHPVLLTRFRVAMALYFFIGGAYVLSALPLFWVDTPIGHLRFVFWYSSLAFIFLGVIYRRMERNYARAG